MSLPASYAKKHFDSQKRRSLGSAIGQRIAEEFPRIGGPRMQQLCAELVMEVIGHHVRPLEQVRHGQVLWAAISRDCPPGHNTYIGQQHLVPVILNLSCPSDIELRLAAKPNSQVLVQRCVRLCEQAYEQGAVLSGTDLGELLSVSVGKVAQMLSAYEQSSGKIVPRRATVHDVGSGMTHKRIICLKRYAEGKSSEQIARETYHSVEAVDRYLGQFDRVRCCLQDGMSVEQIAFILRCTERLVRQYVEIDNELKGK